MNGCLPYLGVLALRSIPQVSLGFVYLAPAEKKAAEFEMRLAGIFVLPDSRKEFRLFTLSGPFTASAASFAP